MASFRKSLLLAAGVLALSVGTVSAQTCNTSVSQPPILRGQGTSEMTGQISFTCANITAGTVNLQVQEAAAVTSRVGEPFLTVAQAGQLTKTVVGQVTGNIVTYNNVPLYAGTDTVIIGGIRINASSVPNNSSAAFVPAAAFLNITSAVGTVLPVLTSNYVVGDILAQPFTASTLGATAIPGANPCAATPTTIIAGQGASTITIGESLLDADAFKVQNSLTQDSETADLQAVAAGFNDLNVLYAYSGTIVGVNIVVPAGLTVYVPTTLTSAPAGGTLQLVTLTAGAPTLVAPTATTPTAINGGVGYYAVTASTTIYYAVTATLPQQPETYTFTVYPVGPNTGVATAGVFLATAPSATAGVIVPPSFTGTIPATSATAGAVTAAGLINLLPGVGAAQPCQTSLLYTFLTNQSGFDTGISIAATGTDPFATGATNGGAPLSCSLYLYGVNAPAAAVTLPAFATGAAETHTTISAVAPNFQGYGVAVCNFTYAHGYAFITDGFMGPGKGLSEGYVANVLSNTTRGVGKVASTNVNGTGSPEVLGH